MSTQGRGWIPGARHYPLVMMSISVGILLVILLEFSLILTFPSISPGISEDFPALELARGWPCCLSGRDANQTKGTAR